MGSLVGARCAAARATAGQGPDYQQAGNRRSGKSGGTPPHSKRSRVGGAVKSGASLWSAPACWRFPRPNGESETTAVRSGQRPGRAPSRSGRSADFRHGAKTWVKMQGMDMGEGLRVFWGAFDVPWKTRSLWEARRHFVQAALCGIVSVAQWCRQAGLSQKTGFQWLVRFRAEGGPGLRDRSRQPHHSPRRTPTRWRQTARPVRRQHPTWGGKKFTPGCGASTPGAVCPSLAPSPMGWGAGG